MTTASSCCPPDLPTRSPAEAVEMTAYEDFVVEKVKAGVPVIGLYPQTKPEFAAEFAQWRGANNR